VGYVPLASAPALSSKEWGRSRNRPRNTTLPGSTGTPACAGWIISACSEWL